jgi:2-polyprenyl-3-methyl-5-hydroxy-6-metoxy-1,4-benzoquinol methylase
MVRKNDWKTFWAKELTLTEKKSRAFRKNYEVMKELLEKHFGIGGLSGLTSMEVGCGRGMMSKYLTKDGVETSGMDKLARFKHFNDNFVHHDILAKDTGYYNFILDMRNKYDVVFTYGLMEHLNHLDIGVLEARCGWMCRDSGIVMHYVVPKKLANMFENNDVVRYNMGWFGYGSNPQLWVYPVFDWMNWKTNKYFGKGFWTWEATKYT